MRKIVFVLFIFSGCFALSQSKSFQIGYAVNYEFEKFGKGEFLDSNSLEKPFSDDLVINLQTEGSFSTSIEKGKLKYYDLEKELIYNYSNEIINSVVPIFSIIDYRIAEYENRIFLTSALSAGGVSDVFGDLANLESVFGIENTENNIRDSIDLVSKDGLHIYKVGQVELVRVKYSKTKLPNDFKESFQKFMTYESKCAN